MKRFTALVLLAALLFCAAARAENVSNWYEIFVRSYQDSDGDGLGDLNGVRERLDYIEDMGWRGLWLMPVMPSPSYHKYDVTDYRAIDPEYGTMDDMRALVAECHARGIRIIIDLPLNHTSTLHPWFQAARDALRAGDATGARVDWYSFRQDAAAGYVPLEDTGWFYEEQFAGGGMPDLNLDNPAVLAEIDGILDFWLRDVGVDGFRLDAVTSYFTGDAERNVTLLRRLKQTCEALKPGSFLVGECWAGLETIARYYESGVDSFFLFPSAQAEGFVVSSMRARRGAESFAKAYGRALDAIGDGRLAPFLSNHDTGRTVGLVQGRANPDAVKFAHGLAGTMGGGVFTYYGEEIGMVGSADDPSKRLAMYWSDEDMTLQPPGASQIEYAHPSVEDQSADPGSILNYVRSVNRMRLAFPRISEGENAFERAEGNLLLMRRSDETGSVLIAVNFSSSAEAVVESLENVAIGWDLEVADGAAALEPDGDALRLVLPPRAIVVLEEQR